MAEVRSCSLLDLHCRGYSGGCKAILIFPGPTVRVQFAVVRQAPYFNNFSLFLPPRKSSQIISLPSSSRVKEHGDS